MTDAPFDPLDGYSIEQEDAWTWWLRADEPSDYILEVFDRGDEYEVTRLVKKHGRLLPKESTRTNKVGIEDALKEIEPESLLHD